jgi:hypothetical protein
MFNELPSGGIFAFFTASHIGTFSIFHAKKALNFHFIEITKNP